MLELISVSHIFSRLGRESLTALDHVSFHVPAGHLLAVIGAAGSGKSTLLQLLAGMQSPTAGSILFRDRDITKTVLHPNDIGFVPASDDVLYDVLTVRESVMSALMLRVAGQTNDQRVDRASHLLVGVGLENVASQRVGTLNTTQRRRLKLALALASDPPVVICDEFTDGLDAKSAQEMAALLKFTTTDHPARVVIHATQTAGNLVAYDTVVILHEGHVCFHGPSRAVTHYFSIQAIEELYPRLAKRPAARWGESWTRHRDSYYAAFKLGTTGESLKDEEDESTSDSQRVTLPVHKQTENAEDKTPTESPVTTSESLPLPTLMAQVKHLIQRRWTVMQRTQKEWLQHLAHLLLPPFITILLIQPNAHYISEAMAGSTDPKVLWPAAYTCTMGWLLQVMMVLGFGVRKASREIAGEEGLYRREATGGLRPMAYLLGKLGYLLPVILVHSLWLGLAVEIVTGGLPGFILPRLVFLSLTAVSFTMLCLAISAWSHGAERAHSRGWMLAYTNVLLAGALLGFPRVLGAVLHPLVTAYYGWASGMGTLEGTPVYEPLTSFVRTGYPPVMVTLLVLIAHFAIGMLLTLQGLRRKR